LITSFRWSSHWSQARQIEPPSSAGVGPADGRASVFSLAASSELLSLLGVAERLLAVTGDAVVLCPTYGETADR
jgi:hypothetical protein